MRTLPTRLKVVFEAQGQRGSLRVEIPRNLKPIPLNLETRDETVVKQQLAMGRELQVGLFTGYFDPIHPIHIGLAALAMAEENLDGVVFLPNERSARRPEATLLSERLGLIQALTKFFYPLFYTSVLKVNRNNREMVELFTSLNADNIRYNWITSTASGGASGEQIYQKMMAGQSLDRAVGEAISPHLSHYLFFYYPDERDNEVVVALSGSAGKVKVIELPESILPFRALHASLQRGRQPAFYYTLGSWGAGITFEFPSDPTVN